MRRLLCSSLLSTTLACGDPPREEHNPFASSAGEGGLPADSGASTDAPIDPTMPTSATNPVPNDGDDSTTGAGMASTAALDDGDQTSGDPASTGDDESTGEPSSDTYNDGMVDVAVSQQSAWAQGECNDVTVTNVSGAMLTWEVTLELAGTIDQLWNANVEESDGTGVFTGVDFNATLASGATAMFGFCVLY